MQIQFVIECVEHTNYSVYSAWIAGSAEWPAVWGVCVCVFCGGGTRS